MVLSARQVLGFGIQTLVGTPVNPTIMAPVLPGTLRISERFEQVLDQGRRGPDAMDFRAVQGVALSELQWDGMVQQGDSAEKQVIGYLLDNFLGANSTATQIGVTGNYKHDLKLGTTKEYLTVEHTALRDANDQRIPACRVHEVVIRYNAGEGALRYSVRLTGRKVIKVTAQGLTDKTGDPFRGWQAQVTFNGVTSFARLLSAEWTLRRSVEPLYAGTNTQDFTDLFLGPLEVTCNLVLSYSVATDIDVFRNKNQGSLVTMFQTGTAGTSSERTFALGGAVFDYGDGPAELDVSNVSMRVGLTARGLYTTANGPLSGSAQNGPVEVQIVQPIATSY